MRNETLKCLAIACKILAIVTCVVLPIIFRPRWGINRIADIQLVGLAALSLIPNRWLVSSRIVFVLFLLLTLFPFRVFFYAFKDADLGLVTAGIFVATFLFVPLPLSLILSRMRFQRGQKFTYA
jgi:hypothetical protein